MKRTFLILFISILVSCSFGQKLTLTPRVDERIDLLSIIFRLAGSEEYRNNTVKRYTDSIDRYFGSFKDHPAVRLARKARDKRGVSYDAVMSMAIHLVIRGDSVIFSPDAAKGSLDKRWGSYAVKFIPLLGDFYRATRFHDFFVKNEPLYAEAEKRFSAVSSTIDADWFTSFFGRPPEGSYRLVISLANYGNYGPAIIHKNGESDKYSIISAYETDSLGMPVFSTDVAATIVHEFCHSFCNPAGNYYYPQMQPVADDFYKTVSGRMKRQAYGTAQTMVNEILVRASVIRYYRDHGAAEPAIRKMLRTEEANGFLWIGPLDSALSVYAGARDRFPTFDSFMPEIVALQNALVPASVYEAYIKNSPRILSFSIENNSRKVDASLNEILVTFDRPMAGRGLSYGKGGAEAFPKISSAKWRDEKKTELVLTVALEPGKNYSLRFPEQFNIDKNGYGLDRMYELNFQTAKW